MMMMTIADARQKRRGGARPERLPEESEAMQMTNRMGDDGNDDDDDDMR